MASLFTGSQYGQVFPARLGRVKLASKGHAFTHATEAIQLGIRQDASLKFKSPMVKDAAGKNFANGRDVDIDAKGMQTTMDDLLNALLLSRNFHQMWAIDGGGQNWAFLNNTGGGTPNGTSLLGMTFKFELTKNTRSIDYKWMTRLFNHEYKYMLDHLTNTPTGGTGGASIGLTANVYDRADFVESGIIDVTIDGNSIGVFDEAKFELQSSGPKDYRERVISNMLTVKGEATVKQTAKNDFLAAYDASNLDYPINFINPTGETWRFISSLSVNEESNVSDKENTLKLIFEGEVPYNIDDTTPNSIDLGLAVPGTATFQLIGY